MAVLPIALSLLLAPPSPQPGPSPDAREDARILAVYRGGDVTAREYRDYLRANGLPDDASRRRPALGSAAFVETLVAAAKASGVDAEPLTRFRVAEAQDALLVAELQRVTNEGVRVTDAEVAAELEAEKAELVRPRKVRLRNVFKKVPKGASVAERAAVRATLEAVRARLVAGEDFDAVAYAESDSQTRFQGGAFGMVAAGVLPPDVERVAFALKAGELSQPIETADGFTLLRCDEILESRTIPLDEARATIRRGLTTRAMDARWAALREELLREAAPRYDLDL